MHRRLGADSDKLPGPLLIFSISLIWPKKSLNELATHTIPHQPLCRRGWQPRSWRPEPLPRTAWRGIWPWRGTEPECRQSSPPGEEKIWRIRQDLKMGGFDNEDHHSETFNILGSREKPWLWTLTVINNGSGIGAGIVIEWNNKNSHRPSIKFCIWFPSLTSF